MSSPEHGSYRCKLRGLCSPPLPQVRVVIVAEAAVVAVAVIVAVVAEYITAVLRIISLLPLRLLSS